MSLLERRSTEAAAASRANSLESTGPTQHPGNSAPVLVRSRTACAPRQALRCLSCTNALRTWKH